MQLQYENHSSLVLEVYGKILASMFFFGLILTTFTGKVHIFMIFYLIYFYKSSRGYRKVGDVRARHPLGRYDGQYGQEMGTVLEQSHESFYSKRQDFFVRTF